MFSNIDNLLKYNGNLFSRLHIFTSMNITRSTLQFNLNFIHFIFELKFYLIES